MTAVPVARQFIAGETETDSYLNAGIRTPLLFTMGPPLCIAIQTSAQTFTTSTVTPITFNVNVIDATTMHSTSSNTSRFNAVYPGEYDVKYSLPWVANGTGIRAAWIRVNGSLDAGGFVQVGANASDTSVAAAETLYLQVGDYVEVCGYQTSGGNLNSDAGVHGAPRLSIRWVSL